MRWVMYLNINVIQQGLNIINVHITTYDVHKPLRDEGDLVAKPMSQCTWNLLIPMI